MLFFFSSRRRHTRCSRDWSSDVCSSDLTSRARSSRTTSHRACEEKRTATRTAASPSTKRTRTHTAAPSPPLRSEERRVGKECRPGVSQHHSKKKKEAASEDQTKWSSGDV